MGTYQVRGLDLSATLSVRGLHFSANLSGTRFRFVG